jgi:hypothetical protein
MAPMVFPHAEVDVAAMISVGEKIPCAFKGEIRFVGFRQVSRPADEPGNIRRERVQRFARALAGSHPLGIGREGGQVFVPAVGELATLHAVDLVSQLRKLFFVLGEFRAPGRVGFGATFADAVLELIVDAVRHEELCVFRPAVIPLDQFHFGFAERLAVRFVGVLFVRGAVADVAIHDDERWTIFRFQESVVSASEHA